MIRCRCSKCRHRKSFYKHPERYSKPKKCTCGGLYIIDVYRNTKENKTPCTCDGWWFPHRLGSVGCNYRDSLKLEGSRVVRHSPDVIPF